MLKQKGHQNNQDHNTGVAALENVVASLFNTSEESKYCTCNVCLQNHEIRQRGQQFLKHSSSIFKIELSKIKKFYQFLSSVDHKIFFRMQIADICFFQAGQGKLLVKTKSSAIIAVQISVEMKKQIPNIFVDSKKTANQNQSVGELNNHIKYFEAVVPSFKHGLSNDNLDNKPKNYTFHSEQLPSEQNPVIKLRHSHQSQVAIIKYKDKGLQLVSQKQLRGILKSLAKSSNIQLIQGYVRPHQRQSQFIISEYLDYRKPQNALMFNRSLIQMKTQIGLISKYSKEYIPMQYLEQYQQMLKEMPEEYCLYSTYKMVHYIEINRDVKIKCLNTVWFKDELSQINFFGVMQFDYEENEKVSPDSNTILQLKDVFQTEPTDLERQLLGAWQNMKKRKMKEYRQNASFKDTQTKPQNLQLKKKQSSPKNQTIYSNARPSSKK